MQDAEADANGVEVWCPIHRCKTSWAARRKAKRDLEYEEEAAVRALAHVGQKRRAPLSADVAVSDGESEADDRVVPRAGAGAWPTWGDGTVDQLETTESSQGLSWIATYQLSLDIDEASTKWKDFIAKAKGWDKIIFARGQVEKAPDTGRYHGQLALRFGKNVRRAAIMTALGDMWIARAKNWLSVVKYCRKARSKADGFDELVIGADDATGGDKHGKRTDLEALYAFVRPLAEKGVDKRVIVSKLIEHFPGQYMQYHGGIDKVISASRVVHKPFLVDRANFFAWQEKLVSYLEGPVEPRRVLVILGENGNEGKSAIKDYIFHTMGGIPLSGKLADMAHIVLGQPDARIVMFDVTRTAADFSAHLASFAENMKDGIVIAQKYESEVRAVSPKHVVFFFNEIPLGFKEPTAEGKFYFSKDRVHVWRVHRDGFSCIMPGEPLKAASPAFFPGGGAGAGAGAR